MSERPNPVIVGALLGLLIWGMILAWDRTQEKARARASAALAASVSVPAVAPAVPVPSAKPWRDYFDVAKKDREIEWCERHGGVPDLTFSENHSNVMCVKPWAVIPIPQKDGGP